MWDGFARMQEHPWVFVTGGSDRRWAWRSLQFDLLARVCVPASGGPASSLRCVLACAHARFAREHKYPSA